MPTNHNLDIVDQKIQEFFIEVAKDSDFQPLLDHPSVKVDISTIHPFCFRAVAHMADSPACKVFELLSDVMQRPRWDAMCESISILRNLTHQNSVIYHLKLKATWPTSPRDALSTAAFRKLADGRFITVAWSIVDDTLCPPDPSGKYIRMHTRISVNLITPHSDGQGCTLTQLIDGDPKGSIPAYLVKKVSAKSFPATIESIKKATAEQ